MSYLTNTSRPFIVYAVQKFLQVIYYLQFFMQNYIAYCLMCCKGAKTSYLAALFVIKMIYENRHFMISELIFKTNEQR